MKPISTRAPIWGARGGSFRMMVKHALLNNKASSAVPIGMPAEQRYKWGWTKGGDYRYQHKARP